MYIDVCVCVCFWLLSCVLLRTRTQGDAPPSRQELSDSVALGYADLGRWMSGWGWWGHDLRHKIEPLLDRLDGGTALASEGAYREAVEREFPVARRVK